LTLSGNSADFGGGIYNGGAGTVELRNSTLSGNSATTGGGIENAGGTSTLTNTIVTASPSGGNCAGAITNGGHNLDSATTCGWGSNDGSLSNTDPLLGPLADNGGITETRALLAGSPAINAGDNSLIPPDVTDLDADGNTSEPLPFDQRGLGFPRIIASTVDIGAFEADSPTAPTPTRTPTATSTPTPGSVYQPLVVKLAGPPAKTAPTATPTPTSTPTPTEPPASGLDGTWVGTTSQGKEISFTIVDHSFTSFTVGYKIGGCGGTTTTTFGIPQPIAGNTFTMTQPAGGATTIFTDGTFDSDSTASGTSLITGTPCGDATTTWTASKQ
jgi:hypothetical protein